MSLSVCLVTRNEEEKLARVIGSVRGLADEVLVADTGSTDRTAAVAAELGARVVQHDWQDDFSAARNCALDQATGDWILWLNPDEELLPTSRELLAAYQAREDVLAYVVRVQELPRPDRLDYFSETVQLRLFRRHPELRYRGRLHPSFAGSVQDLARREGKQVLASELVLRHHAYQSQLAEPKLRWAARLMGLELRDRPGQLHDLIEYGRALLALNDPRGHEVLAEAAAQLDAARDARTPPSQNTGLLLEYLLTVSPAQSRSRVTAEEAAGLVMQWYPHSPPLLWRLAELFFQRGDPRRAAGLLEQLVHYGRTGSYDRSAAFDPAIIGDAAVLNLGVCYVRTGDLSRAEQSFTRVLTSATHGEHARQHLAELARRRASGAGPGPAQKG